MSDMYKKWMNYKCLGKIVIKFNIIKYYWIMRLEIME
jgi:hypothetical protein